MRRGRSGRSAVGLVNVVAVAALAACGQASDVAPAASTLGLSVATYPTDPPSTTMAPATVPASVAVTRDVAYTPHAKLDVYAPRAAGPHPTVVIFPGRSSTKAVVSNLAGAVAEAGAVVLAVDYRGRDQALAAVADGRCAAGFAAANAVTYGGDGGPLVLVGVGTGVDVAVGEGFAGPWRASAPALECAHPGGGPIGAVVGVVGSYPAVASAEAGAHSPLGQVAASPEVPVWLVEGAKDQLGQIDRAQTEAFRDALAAAGHAVTARLVDDVPNLALLGLEISSTGQPAMIDGGDRRGLELSVAEILAATRAGRS
jgi:hypothetical protein